MRKLAITLTAVAFAFSAFGCQAWGTSKSSNQCCCCKKGNQNNCNNNNGYNKNGRSSRGCN